MDEERQMEDKSVVFEEDVERPDPTWKITLGINLRPRDSDTGEYFIRHGVPKWRVGSNSDIDAVAAFENGQGLLIGFPLAAITSGDYFFAQISGVITAAAGTVAAGDHVKVLDAGTTVVVDGSTGSTTRSAKTIGIAKTATSGGTASIVVMPGRLVHVEEPA